MASPINIAHHLSDVDLEFLVAETAQGASNPDRFKGAIREDESLRAAIVGDDRVFQRVMADEEILVKISPALYFEILLRRATRDLETTAYTVERAGRQEIPVFDTNVVIDLLSRTTVLDYLATMLASFTRIHSQVTWVRVRRGLRRKVRRNDMDIDSLIRMCLDADENERYGYYKRIADVCLFITGVFPDYTYFGSRYAATGEMRPASVRGRRRSLEEYEEEGRRFYGLAEQHPTSRLHDLSDVFATLREHFTVVRKPLTFISTHYFHARGAQLFATGSAP